MFQNRQIAPMGGTTPHIQPGSQGLPPKPQIQAPAPAPNQAPQKPNQQPQHASIIHDITHNPVTNFVGNQIVKPVAKGGAQFVNQGFQEGKQVVDTSKMMTANATHNPTAFANANKQSQKDYAGFKTSGGLGNQGTITTKQEAQQGTAHGAEKIIGDTALLESTLIPGGGGAAAKGASVGARIGMGAAKGALAGATFGAGSSMRQGAKAGEVAKNAAIGGATGAVLGGAGEGAGIAAKAGINKAAPAIRDGAAAVKGQIKNALPVKPVLAGGKDVSGVPAGETVPQGPGAKVAAPIDQKPISAPKQPGPGMKERSVTKNMRQSPEFSPELRSQISSEYKPFSDAAANQNTDQFMKQSLANAQKQVMAALSTSQGKAGQIGDRFTESGGFGKQEVSNAQAVMKALDQKGDTEGAQAIHDALAAKLTNAGQTVQAAQLIYNRSPEGLVNMAYRDLGKAGIKVTPEIKAQLDAVKGAIKDATPGSRDDLLARARFQKLVGSKIPTSTGTKALSIWKTGILSSPKTAVKVGIVQPVTNVAEQSADAVGSVFDKAASLFTGHRSMVAPNAKNIAYGAKVGATQGLQDAKTRFMENIALPGSTGMGGEELGANGFRAEGANFGVTKGGGRSLLDRATGGVSSKVLNGYTSMIGRTHGALQTPWYEGRGAQALMQSAQAEAKNQGLKGPEADTFIQKFIANPPKWAKDVSSEASQYSTSQQKTALGQTAKGLQHTLPGGQIIAPITRVPGAVATQVVNYSPAGFLKTAGKAVMDAKHDGFDMNAQQAFSRGMGRATVGSAVMAGGAALAAQGRMSGEYPKDKATQALWTRANIPANSVYVGGKAYPGSPWKNSGGSWQQIGSPGGAPAQAALTGGAIADGYKQGGVPQAIVQGTAGGAKIVTDQPYLTGVSGAMTAINTPSQAKSFLDQTAGSVIPNAVRDYAQATDPLQRQTSVSSPITSVKNSITNGIPGVREKNLPQVDLFGNNIPRNNISTNDKVNVLNSMLNPYNPQLSRNSDITNALGDIHNVKDQNGKPLTIPTQLDKKITLNENGKKVQLSDAQRTQLIKTSGQASQSEIQRLMQSDTWKNATPQQRSEMLAGSNGVVTGQRDLAKHDLGNSTKLTAAGNAAQRGSLPTLNSSGKATYSGNTNDPRSVYQAKLAKFQQGVKNGTISGVEQQKQADALARENITSLYAKDTVSLYGESATKINEYLAQHPNDKGLRQQLANLDNQLYKAGFITKTKINADGTATVKGQVARGSSKSSSGGGSKGGGSNKVAGVANTYKTAQAFGSTYTKLDSLLKSTEKIGAAKKPTSPRVALKSYTQPKAKTSFKVASSGGRGSIVPQKPNKLTKINSRVGVISKGNKIPGQRVSSGPKIRIASPNKKGTVKLA